MHLRSRPCCADVGLAVSSSTAWRGRQQLHRLRQSRASSASAVAAGPEQLDQWVSNSNQQRLTALEASRAVDAKARQLCVRLGCTLGLHR